MQKGQSVYQIWNV